MTNGGTMKKTSILLITLLSAAGIACAQDASGAKSDAGSKGANSAPAAATSQGASGASGSTESGKGYSGSSATSFTETPGVACIIIMCRIPVFCGMIGSTSAKKPTNKKTQTKSPITV